MLSTPSQVLLRNAELFNEGRWLLVNAEDSAIFHELTCSPDGYHQQYNTYSAANAAGLSQHYFGASFEASDVEPYDGIVVYMPKAKTLTPMLLANMVTALKPNGALLMVGDNKGGIKSAPKFLSMYSDNVSKVDSARRCSLYATRLEHPVRPFALSDWLTTHTLNVADVSLKVAALPGVFSAGSLDMGTRLLLENLTVPNKGQVLDFACGCGVVAAFAALKQPAIQLTLTDVNALAVYCAEQTLALNGLDGKVLAADGLNDVSGRFDAVLTNPPFHTGLKTDYGITERFIKALPKHLTSKGYVQLVANRFLDYAPILEQHLSKLTTLTETPKFRIYQASFRRP